MIEIFFLIVPSFIVIFAGSLLKAFKIADDVWTDVLNKYGLWIGFPSLIFETLIRLSKDELINASNLLIVNALFLIFLFLLTLSLMKLLKFNEVLTNTFSICIFFGNVAYLGYPVIMSVFPQKESELSIIISVYVMVLFTIGVGWLEYSRCRRLKLSRIILRLLANPFIISIVLGILFVILGIRVPDFLKKTLFILKSSASPVVLIALGVFIYRKINIKNVLVPVLVLSVVKLIVVPFLFTSLLILTVGIKGYSMSIIDSAMPLAVTPFALSSVYKLDKDIISNAIIVSTIISLITLPFLMNIIKAL